MADETDELRRLRRELAEARDELRALPALRRRLEEAETEAASIPELERRADQLERRAAAIARDLEEARAEYEDRLARSSAVIEGMQGSVSWRVTRPLRALRRRAG